MGAFEIGEIIGIFFLTFIVYKVTQYLILRNKQSVLMIIMRFVITSIIVLPFAGYGDYDYIRPFYTHLPFIVLYMVIDLVKKIREDRIVENGH